MKLRDYSRLNLDSVDTRYICNEVQIGNMTALLLGVQTFEEMAESCAENDWDDLTEAVRTRMYILYEDDPECGDCDDFESYSNRQMLMRAINEKPEPDVVNIEEIKINNRIISHSEMNNGCIEWVEFRTKKFLLDAMKQGLIPERWSDIDSERIWIAEYIFDNTWDFDELLREPCEFEFAIREKAQIYLICKSLICRIGDDKYDVFNIEIDGEEIPVTVRGLENIDGFNKKILAVAYKTRENVQLDFYSKKHLEEISNNSAIGIALLADESEWRYSVIEAAEEDWTKEIEIELFSAHIMSR
ncbi:MAG: hypothetical protein ACI4LD_04560 [Lentihominibacter sp.]